MKRVSTYERSKPFCSTCAIFHCCQIIEIEHCVSFTKFSMQFYICFLQILMWNSRISWNVFLTKLHQNYHSFSGVNNFVKMGILGKVSHIWGFYFYWINDDFCIFLGILWLFTICNFWYLFLTFHVLLHPKHNWEIIFFLGFPRKVLTAALLFIQECTKLLGKVSNFGIHLWE